MNIPTYLLINMAPTHSPRNPYARPSLYLQLLSPLKLLARILDLLFSSIRSLNAIRNNSNKKKNNNTENQKKKKKKKNLTIIAISDTHTLIPPSPLPFGDILIHAGDLSNAGTPKEIQSQINWLHAQPHTYKIVIAGNHDSHLDPRSRGTLALADRNEDVNWRSVIYLQDSFVILKFPCGGDSSSSSTTTTEKQEQQQKDTTTTIKIYGSPFIPHVGGPSHAFQHPRSQDHWTGKVPSDTEILISHCPPKCHLDLPGVEAMGDEFLLHEVRRTKPLVHIFGHIHAGRSDVFGKVRGGKEVVRWDRAERHLVEVLRRESAVTWKGCVLSMANLVLWYHFVAFVYYSVKEGLCEWLMGHEEPPTTTMVNAAMMYEDEGRLGNAPQVIHI